MVNIIQAKFTQTPVRLSIHHFRSLPVDHTVISVRMVRYCRLVFCVCRGSSCLPSETSSCYGFNFFFLCSSSVVSDVLPVWYWCGTHSQSCVCLPLYLFDALICVWGSCVVWQLMLYRDVLGYAVPVPGTPWTHGSVTTHLDFSLFLSLVVLRWFCCFSLTFLIVHLG